MIFPIIGMKINQPLVPDADQEILTLQSTDKQGNLVNLFSGTIHLPSGWDFTVRIRDQPQILFIYYR